MSFRAHLATMILIQKLKTFSKLNKEYLLKGGAHLPAMIFTQQQESLSKLKEFWEERIQTLSKHELHYGEMNLPIALIQQQITLSEPVKLLQWGKHHLAMTFINSIKFSKSKEMERGTHFLVITFLQQRQFSHFFFIEKGTIKENANKNTN